ncbi:hypothetical protein DFP74_3598 [Nocardiopsis sp. Huas11]|uniref:exo-rhamnogalacturonan lyase family protein n=1 Tax=Nocardiopsis sp. Huas11 TaxID=2183912 RepID=UPI000F26C866|nr:Tat pathway signal sequence domain protein [Nocardiopsis sp. Huas11]RKS07910.1 hypothetical protein DFP74_3598 [Nocardiopsis sp. Huas11]
MYEQTGTQESTRTEYVRRDVLKGMAATGVAVPLTTMAVDAGWGETVAAATLPTEPAGAPDVGVRWLEGVPSELPGATWGTPWPKGAVAEGSSFALHGADGTPAPLQTWPTAFWPDGTVKWTGHAIPGSVAAHEEYTLGEGTPAEPETAVSVATGGREVTVSTGVITAKIPTRGQYVVSSVERDGVVIASDGELVALKQDDIVDDVEAAPARRHAYRSWVDEVTVEQEGPVRAVVRVEGTHRAARRGKVNGRQGWLPFTLRLYFFAGSDSFRVVHSFVLDSDGTTDFVAGLGMRFAVPMHDELYNRHVRLLSGGERMVAEAVQGVTGLRRDPSAQVRAAQVAGERLPDIGTWDPRVGEWMHYVPAWGDHTLSQLTSEGFSVRKRTASGHGWVPVDQGRRAAGTGYVGGVGGGLVFGMRDFWQRHPAQLDVRGAHTDEAQATIWMWSPEAGPMDTRFYHDGMGQDTHADQLDGLNINYEDYEPDFGTPYGIARTTELTFWAVAATPSAERLGAMGRTVSATPQIVNSTSHLTSAGVFGGLFAPVDRTDPVKAEIEANLDFLFDYYSAQVEQRHWYGFWDYGDIMHTFDEDRQVWRYDIGGYAWDNSELSPDLWLWYAFMRSGRADVFRMAEAMTRHTGEVDVYHLGQWAGLGTRHNVQHWGCSAKQQRISTAGYRRMFYFLTADERTGDLMRALVDSDETFLALDPLRKIRTEPYEPDRNALAIGLGTDWSGLAFAWLTEWERRGPKAETAEAKLRGTMESIAAMPNGFIQGEGLYDLDSGVFAEAEAAVGVSHLSAMFGQVEVCAELIDLVDMPEFEEAWLQYCRLYNATREEQTEEVGEHFGNLILRQGHSRLDAYAAVRLGEDAYAERAWRQFLDPQDGWEYPHDRDWSSTESEHTLNPADSAPWVSTNTTALFGLAAIQNLALIGDKLPRT